MELPKTDPEFTALLRRFMREKPLQSSGTRWISASIFSIRPTAIPPEPVKNTWGGRCGTWSPGTGW